MEVNPYTDETFTLLDQPELSHINNVLQFPFLVISENKNPLLDVTINGRHIMNKDIIAPTSEIVISLKDENPYLVMNSDADTSLFGIYLTDPDGVQKRVYFVDQNGNQNMTWVPANNQNKKFKITFPKYFDKSGIYTLLVQGTDRSGNLSGDLEYKISFEVIHESMISQMINYPNPFSTSTRFVFTVTGDEIPDDIQIQIMTVSGKVVREISESEIGPIQIGRNVSQFAWDGKDQFGDPLANGVYLYRVKAKIKGQDIKHLETGADDYFHKGLGKMYLLR
jgi:flagellar hook assembly protein FlgD